MGVSTNLWRSEDRLYVSEKRVITGVLSETDDSSPWDIIKDAFEQNNENMKEFWKDMFNPFTDNILAFKDLMSNTFDNTLETQQRLWGSIDGFGSSFESHTEKTLKEQKSILAALNAIRQDFSVGTVSPGVSLNDSYFVTMLKNLINPLPEEISKRMESIFSVGTVSPGVSSNDSDFVTMLKNLFASVKPPETNHKIDDRVIKFLETLNNSTSTINTNVAKLLDLPTDKPVLDSAALDILKSLDETSTSIDKGIVSLLKAIKDLSFGDQIINNEKGTTIWDVFNRLIDFLDNFTETLMSAFIPEDVTFISSAFDGLNDTINKKFEGVSFFENTIKSTIGGIQEEDLPEYLSTNIDFSFSVGDYHHDGDLGEVNILDMSYITKALDYIKIFISGLLYLFTAIWGYKKVTNDLLV